MKRIEHPSAESSLTRLILFQEGDVVGLTIAVRKKELIAAVQLMREAYLLFDSATHEAFPDKNVQVNF